MKRTVVLALTVLLAVASTVSAQSKGNIYGTVTDESGAVVPGATATLTGPTIGKLSTVTGAQGDFHFLSLDPSTYKIEVSLAGFSTVVREAIVNSGSNVNLTFGLKVAAQPEVVTVTAETPVVDTKRVGTSTTLTKEELSDIPNSRDPWALLRSIPGVVVDRVNVAGNESGQQSSFQGKGSSTNDSTWTLDGVVVTDMAAVGASPTYWDYDAFDEVNITTGGNDLKVATGGVGLNFVTKRGTNNFHGNVHTYFTDHKLESSNLSGSGVSPTDPRLKLPSGSFTDLTTHIAQIADYGADLGGPLIKDKLWFWGSYGKQDIRNVNFNQTNDKTILKDYSGKLNWQASPSDMVSIFYFNGEKDKFGRNDDPFVSNNPTSFLHNQGGAYSGGPHGLSKFEWNHIFGPSFTIDLKYAYYNAGFGFTPIGGADKDGGVNFVTDTAVGSYFSFSTLRPQHTANLDGNYFFAGAGGNNELKFGFGYRHTSVTSSSALSGDGLFANVTGTDPATGLPNGIAWVTRPSLKSFYTEYMSGYLGDTYTSGRLSLNVGARYDHQKGGNSPSSAPASAAFANLLPAFTFPGTGQGVTWNNVSPRVAITYALDEARKTVVRGSYALYAGQLPSGDAAFDNPLAGYNTLAYNWIDLNHDGLVQPNEILFNQGLQYAVYVDPNNPTSAASVNKIDPNYKANTDNEFIVGFDREIAPDFALSAAYTYRKETNVTQWDPRIGFTSADYTAGPLTSIVQNGTTYTAQTFSPIGGLLGNGGHIETNRPDFNTQYGGFEVSLVKRLSHKWMARGTFAYMDWTEHLTGPGAVGNPTRTDVSGLTIGTALLAFSGPQVDGGVVAPRSSGSGKGDIFFGPKWQVNANAMYQLGAGFDVSGNLFARQGYPEPLILRLSAGADGALRVLSTPTLDATRYKNLYDLDLRLQKTFNLGGSGHFAIIADGFNIFNSNTVLNLTRQLNSSAYNRINELLNPRIFRFGVRLGF